MPKKKKTRKQKILADMRHKVVVEEPKIEYKSQPSQPQADRIQQSSVKAIATSSYQYLYSDLVKTIVLTISIIVGEMVLGHLFA